MSPVYHLQCIGTLIGTYILQIFGPSASSLVIQRHYHGIFPLFLLTSRHNEFVRRHFNAIEPHMATLCCSCSATCMQYVQLASKRGYRERASKYVHMSRRYKQSRDLLLPNEFWCLKCHLDKYTRVVEKFNCVLLYQRYLILHLMYHDFVIN